MSRDLERLARRAAGGDLMAAKRLLAELMARSTSSDDEQGLYAVILERHRENRDGMEQEVISLHPDRPSALAAAADRAAGEIKQIRDGKGSCASAADQARRAAKAVGRKAAENFAMARTPVLPL